jgi:chromosome segregation protein
VYLKKLEMRGFKTFADRTELEFGPGITAIVGPNGVGKSNIADAILWVLGEQSNRALRTETSQDVIFAGSESRRPLGMAEVALTVDNTDQRLGVDYSEVIVARRLFRSGESEYLLNRATTRLRDIRDLFLDTGIGPGAYSVIGQGEIDAILSIRSEDRRELLEEVAGVRKYRVRRDEATRKLEATVANMTRVADIVAELSSQRGPLEQEAEKARAYNEYSEKLRDLDLHLLAGDFQRRRLRLGKLANELEITRADEQGTRNQLSQVEGEYEKLQFELARLSDEVDQLRDEASRAERALDQARQAQALAEERVRAARARQGDLQVALEGRKRRAQELEEQLASLRAEQDQVQQELTVRQRERDELSAQLQEKQRAFEEKMRRVRELERKQRELLDKARALENEALALQSLEADLQERAERLARQAVELTAREAALAQALAESEAAREQLDREVFEGQERLGALRADLAKASRLLQEHRQKCNLFSGAVTATEARQALLAELDRAREGFSDGARAALKAAAEGKLQGVRGIVADLVDVPARLERAIEAALGDALQWVIVETEEQARTGAQFIRENNAGRCTFLPLTAVAGIPAPTQLQPPGAMGPALKLVRVQRDCDRLFSHLLGDTYIFRDLESALEARGRLSLRGRLVTLAGEVVDSNGAITVGGEEGAGSQAFARRRELEQLARELESLRGFLAEMWRREESLDRWCGRLTEEIRAIEAQISQRQSARARAEADAAHLLDQQRAARKAAQELAEETAALQERLEQARVRREAAEAESERLRVAGNELGAQVEGMRREGVGQAEMDALRAQQVTAQVRAAELAEKQRALQHLLERYSAELARVGEESQRAQAELDAAIAQERELRAALEAPGDQLSELEKRAGTARAAVNERAAVLSRLREKSAELEAMRNRLNHVLQEQSERLHRSELALAREETQLEAIVEGLKDTYGLTPEEAFAERLEEIPEQEIRRQAYELREAIRKLGPVNLSAIDECERLRAREEFLSGQLADLEAARADLLQVIAEIDEAATAEFLRCFERMQKEFQAMFERLFGGGQTQLRLTDPEHPLESGVDVLVQGPGKRQQNLLLLSGGERSLTAMALLFAMLRVRPTPFVLLDEIDAALDEANVQRFVEVLQEFAKGSQFIIITHNPSTIQCADTLFGVTMQDAGVSTLIRLEMRDWEDFLAEAEEQVSTRRTPRAGTRVLPTAS